MHPLDADGAIQAELTSSPTDVWAGKVKAVTDKLKTMAAAQERLERALEQQLEQQNFKLEQQLEQQNLKIEQQLEERLEQQNVVLEQLRQQNNETQAKLDQLISAVVR